MLLEKSRKASSGKRTWHINIQYVFITDRVNMKEVEIEWCPTKEMVADFMTKPLQGSHFRWHLSVYSSDDEDDIDTLCPNPSSCWRKVNIHKWLVWQFYHCQQTSDTSNIPCLSRCVWIPLNQTVGSGCHKSSLQCQPLEIFLPLH